MYSFQRVISSGRGTYTLREYLYQNRLSMRIVYFLANYTNIRPELVNISSLITGIISAFFYSLGPIYYPWAIILHEISYLLDASDGKLARLKNEVTLFGEKLDGFRDKTVHILSLIGLIIGSSQGRSDSIITIGAIYFILLSVNNYFSFRLMQKISPLMTGNPALISSQNLMSRIAHIKINGTRVIPIPTVAEWLFIVFVTGPIFNQVWLGFFIACICIFLSIAFLVYKLTALKKA